MSRGDPDHLATVLAREIGPMRRSLARATRAADNLPDIPENRIEVLRAVAARPGLSPQLLARDLRLARPTVSNLLQDMQREQLVELVRGDGDARRVEVTATSEALALLARYDEAAIAIVEAAVADLSAKDRVALEAATAALVRLSRILAG